MEALFCSLFVVVCGISVFVCVSRPGCISCGNCSFCVFCVTLLYCILSCLNRVGGREGGGGGGAKSDVVYDVCHIPLIFL